MAIVIVARCRPPPTPGGRVPRCRDNRSRPSATFGAAELRSGTAALVIIRLIGVIEADQTEQGNTVRNDRLLAVTICSHLTSRSPRWSSLERCSSTI
jgi:hypothetical protein